jgi:peptidoglycan/xylan/chitin deacetylase (PgdA/CDA1 family)
VNRPPDPPRRRTWLPLALCAIVIAGATAAWWMHDRSGHGAPEIGAPASSPPPTTTAKAIAAPPPAPMPRFARSRVAVPILMYHVIAAPPRGAPFPGLYVRPRELAAQVHALVQAGFRSVTMDQVRAAWLGRGRLPRHPVVLSFDNGYRSQFTEALPILRKAGFVGVENIQLKGLPPSNGGLTAAQVRGLIAAGWELDTQGVSHADLVTQSAASLHFQIAAARDTIRRRYGVPVNWFCYPSGHYDPTVIRAVRRAGFVGSTTVIPGWADRRDDPFRLPRLRVLGNTSPEALLAQIARERIDAPIPPAYPPAA